MPRVPRPCAPPDGSSLLRRTLMLAAAFAFWMLLIAGRLYYLQVIKYVHWLARAQRQQQRTIELAPERGTIYDSRMRPLAMSLKVDSIYAVPSHIADRAAAARELAPILGIDARDLEGRFGAFRSFCWVKRKVTAGVAARVRALDLDGIYFQKEPKRFYPMGDLAAADLGYVGMDDRGLAGIEYALNTQIQGEPGRALVMEDARRQTFESREEDPGKPGMNVELTLDGGIQYIAERVLAADVEKWKAAGGVAVVENPDTGAILAMASYPNFNPNDYAKTPPQDRINRGVAWIYEPGSMFKMITLSSAIDEGVARPADLINCQMGSMVLGGRVIHDAERGLGVITLAQVLAYSSDVGAVKVALRMGQQRFYDHILKFGFGAKTGVLLPGEERGLLMPPSRWSGVSIGQIAIGQGIGVTALQLGDAYAAIANGGTLIQPHIVKDVFRGATHEPASPQGRRRAVSAKTAATMRQMLEGVVEFGTGKGAQLDGYSAAGKTGTAQKVENGRYSHTHYVASFIGMAPASHPALVILVSIDTPHGAIYGAEVAAPAWKEIAQEALSYLNIPRDEPLKPPVLMASARMPQQGAIARPAPVADPAPNSGLAPFSPNSSTPAQAAENSVVISSGPLITVPDFSGLNERKVAGECETLGMRLSLSGLGLAISQNPGPGTRVPEGSSIQVVFAR
ncbi:MAG: penicillin-binding protein [Terriglobia bacterium]